MGKGGPREGSIYAIHWSVRGRARIRVAGLQQRPELKHALETELAEKPGIRNVSANTVTSNVLVYFDPEKQLGEVIGLIEVVVASADLAPAGEPETAGWSFGGFLRSIWQSVTRRSGSQRPVDGHKPPERMDLPWHAVPGSEAAEFWQTSRRRGLTSATAAERLTKYGPNLLPQNESRSGLSILLDQFKSLPVVLLLGSAVLSVATGGIADSVVISIVIVLNAAIGAFTEAQAERTVTSLLNLAEPVAVVLRDGRTVQIRAEEVAPGDVLVLSRGGQVPADARLIVADNLTVDESALTGESMPVEKSIRPLAARDLPLGERVNMVYRGTAITGGSGAGVAIATGAHTEIGRVQEMISSGARRETPMQRQLRALSGQMFWWTGGIAAAALGLGVFRGYSLPEMIRSAIALAVAAVPEGLPTVATVALAGSVKSMMRHKVLVRRLDAIETLGTVDVVCFDKTGTLTLNQMSVVAVSAGGSRYEVSGGTFFSENAPVRLSAHPELRNLLEVCSLCSEAEVREVNGSVEIDGSPTEAALVRMAANSGLDVLALRRRYPLRTMNQRTDQQNYMSTTHDSGGGRRLTAVKGNPGEVLALCDRIANGGGVHPLTDSERRLVQAENDRMAGAALRVLGVASRDAEEDGLVWLGLVGIADPPREGLRELMQEFRRAGIRPVMVTGDQPATARAVGHALDLNGGNHLEVLDSSRLEDESAGLAGQVSAAQIFSRFNPAQKLKIVRALQETGAVVAMTGDGINDGPALKAADVGIALGQGGTRVAREVADVLLTEDNIQTLLPAIRDGRRVHDNIRKAIHYISATNISEVLVMLGSLAAGAGQPLSARQLLWINLITDVFPEIGLAVGPAEPGIMRRPPTDAWKPVIGRDELPRIGTQAAAMAGAAMASYIYGISRYGPGARAGSMAFLTLTAAQLLHAHTARSETSGILDRKPAGRNNLLSMSLAGGFAALLLSQFGLSSALGTERVGLADALVCAGASLASFLTNEAVKASALNRLTEAQPASE